jgi:hypothetical protein
MKSQLLVDVNLTLAADHSGGGLILGSIAMDQDVTFCPS